MFRLAALNERTSVGSEIEEQAQKGTKEAQEAQAFSLYNYALQLQHDQHHNDAISVYEELLETSLVTRAATTLVDENGEATERPLKDPGLILKYSTHKNMASMSADRGDIQSAMQHYLQAVMLDTTDVTLWQCIGNHAITLGRLALARHAFTSGLQCNENHWPSLDAAITVLYALSDYESCLYWIAKALEKDPEYTKGLIFREKMFQECPHLVRDSQPLFRHCSLSIHDADLDEEEAKHYIDEALRLRESHRKICLPTPPKQYYVDQSLKKLSWVSLGESLIAAYDAILESTDFSFVSPIRFERISDTKEPVFETVKCVDYIDVERTSGDDEDTDPGSLLADKIFTSVGTATERDFRNSCTKHAVEENVNREICEEFTTAANQQSTEEDSHGFIDDSATSGGITSSQCTVTSSRPVAQAVAINQDSRHSSVNDVVHDVMETMLQVASSPHVASDVNGAVLDVVNSLITAVTAENSLDSEEVIAVLMEEISKTVEENVKASTRHETERVDANHQMIADAHDSDDEQIGEEKSKKVAKRKKCYLDSVLEEHMMRRSNRVRVSSKKKKTQEDEVPVMAPKTVDYKQKILELLPEYMRDSFLLSEQDDADKEAVTTFNVARTLFGSQTKCDDESDDVMDFITKNDGEYIVNIMQNYTFVLSKKINVLWSQGTAEIMVRIYARSRSHVILPYLTDEDDYQLLKKLLFAMLVCVECQVDLNCRDKQPRDGCTIQDLAECLEYLKSAAARYHIFRVTDPIVELNAEKSLNRDWKAYGLRFLWSRSKHYYNLNKTEEAMHDLETCREILHTVRTNAFSEEDYVVEAAETFVIQLPNTSHHPVISLDAINARLKLLEQAQLLKNANKYFEQEKYSNVVELLMPTVKKRLSHKRSNQSSRARQIRQLMLSCQHLSDYKTIFTSAGYLLREVVATLHQEIEEKMTKKNTDSLVASGNKQASEVSKQWSASLRVTLQIVDRAVTNDEATLRGLCLSERTVLFHGIVEVVQYMLVRLDQGASFPDMPLVWMLLYRVLAAEEKIINLSSNEEDEENQPPSFILLSTAHEWMGTRNVCCSSDGKLLRSIVSELYRRFIGISDLPFKDDVDCALAQCFYCLFAYPNKPKTRRVQEHNAKQVPLTWKDSLMLFQHFRPTHIPEFDSYKASTVPIELSQLILRALPLIPESVKRQIPNTDEEIASFIEAISDSSLPLKLPPEEADLFTLGDMYYLLADYYFKNNEMAKATKYYLQAVRINPDRFDTWAGMALARSSQTDERLRLCEKKNQHKWKESGTERRGLAALACFKHALSYDSNNSKLWIEYGSLAYWLHSMYSRKMKRLGINDEENRKKKEMLRISRFCFERVRECEADDVSEEEWLINYMMGKISEKEGKSLKVYIRFYQTAALLLHNRHAKYPKKIQAKYGYLNDLAIEALEMYFRIHASILKFIFRHSSISKDELNFIKVVLDEAASSPFVRRQELKSLISFSQDSEKLPKLAITSHSSDLSMGSVLPDSILQGLNIEEARTDEDSQSSACSLSQPCGEQSGDDTTTREQASCGMTVTIELAEAAKVPPSEPPKRMTDDDDVDARVETFETNKARRTAECEAIIDACENAFRLCVRRFPHHIKGVYRLAHLYATCPSRKHLSWSRDLLYGSTSPWQQLRHMPAPGLLADRNKTNLFCGVWRIPMDEIDRPGSFPAHVHRCLSLLLDVLHEFKHSETLLHIHNLLHRTPEQGRRYLREKDRITLARRALVFCRGILNRKLKSLNIELDKDIAATQQSGTHHVLPGSHSRVDFKTGISGPNTSSSFLCQSIDKMQAAEDSLALLMEAYKVYQDTLKHNEATTKVEQDADPDDTSQQHLLTDAYHKYTCCLARDNSQVTPSDNQTTLEEAIRFCQQQATNKKATSTSSSAKTLQTVTSSNSQTNSSKTATPSLQLPIRRGDYLTAIKEVNEGSDDDQKKTNESNMKRSNTNSYHKVVEKATPGQIIMVESAGRTYTKIGPPSNGALAPSAGSAFRSTAPLDGRRLRIDPGLRHLQDPMKNRLFRSTSVPVSYPEGEENTPPKRSLHRTGSVVSDSTKLKLKSSILSKTSAALIRKPSITDHEMMQLRTDLDADSDSSQSEDEDDEIEDLSTSRKRKFSDAATSASVSSGDPLMAISSHQSTVITTAGPT